MVKLFEDRSKYPSFTMVKNTRSEIISMSETAARLCGWKNAEEGIGKTDYELPSKVSEIAEQFIKIDKEAIQTSRKVISFDIGHYIGGWNVFLDEKIPLIDSKNRVQGIHCNAMNVTIHTLFKPYLALHKANIKRFGSSMQKVYTLGFPMDIVSLTQKEEVCLFLLMRGKTAKEIAKIRGRSHKTIEDQIGAIKIKMGCSSKAQIIEKAINLGYLYYFPSDV